MKNDLERVMELDREREFNNYSQTNKQTNFHNQQYTQGAGVEFGKWFMRGVALTLAFILTSSVCTAIGAYAFKSVIEHRIEQLINR